MTLTNDQVAAALDERDDLSYDEYDMLDSEHERSYDCYCCCPCHGEREYDDLNPEGDPTLNGAFR